MQVDEYGGMSFVVGFEPDEFDTFERWWRSSIRAPEGYNGPPPKLIYERQSMRPRRYGGDIEPVAGWRQIPLTWADATVDAAGAITIHDLPEVLKRAAIAK
jgi:hypothetical protein